MQNFLYFILEIFWLPTYSPKENLIEILWKFIKYEWIEVNAYESGSSLKKYFKKVVENVGKEYVIPNFKTVATSPYRAGSREQGY